MTLALSKNSLTCLLALIASSPLWSFAGADYEIALDLESGRPVVQLEVNGQGPFPFVVDTGASGFVVRTELVESLGLAVTGQAEAGSPGGGSIEVDLTRLDTISLGGATVNNVEAIIMEGGPMGGQLGAGVIAPTVFSEFGGMEFDFSAYQLTMGADLAGLDDACWVDMGDFYPLLEAMASLDGVSVVTHIDTGNPGIVNFPKSLTNELPLSGDLQVAGRARTVDREFEILSAPLTGEIRISDASIPLNQASFYDFDWANLGMGALHGLNLSIDWQGKRFCLQGLAEPKPMRRRRREPAA